jgi:CHASE1-domain containing sensor protein
MHTNDRREALGYLDEAWRRAAVDDLKRAEQHTTRALDLLEDAVARGQESRIVVRMVRRHVEEGRAAMAQSDLLGAMLGALAALEVLGTDLQANVQNLQAGDRVRSMPGAYAL